MIFDFPEEFVHWQDESVQNPAIDALYEGDTVELDSDTRSFPIYHFDLKGKKLCRGRRMLKLTGFRQGEVRRVGARLAPRYMELNDMPLVEPLTVNALAALTVDPIGISKMALIYSRNTKRVYICTLSSYKKYLNMIKGLPGKKRKK